MLFSIYKSPLSIVYKNSCSFNGDFEGGILLIKYELSMRTIDLS
jgi:hypothetical protein